MDATFLPQNAKTGGNVLLKKFAFFMIPSIYKRAKYRVKQILLWESREIGRAHV